MVRRTRGEAWGEPGAGVCAVDILRGAGAGAGAGTPLANERARLRRRGGE